MVADREEVELADAVGDAVLGVARQRDRLDGERPDDVRASGLEPPVDARRPRHVEPAFRRRALDPRPRLSRLDPRRGCLPHRCLGAGERRDAADVIPVGVRGEDCDDVRAELVDARGDAPDLPRRDAGIDEHRRAVLLEEKCRGLPERALEAFGVHTPTVSSFA